MLATRLPTEQLAPGHYDLRLTVVDSEGREVFSRAVAFQVLDSP